ncbi:MAG: hypothetical protein Q4F17_03430 [Eubacteriales bacterium]|nr:hypothetical protein [Eubacteriales bacterium]
MKKLLEAGNEYCKQSTWKDLALVKFCLAAIGVVIGLLIPDSARTAAFWIAGAVFLVTYIPLMRKFFRIILKK